MHTESSLWIREARLLLRRLGFQKAGWLRAALVHGAVLTAFGLWLPYQKGADFMDSVVLGAYLCLSVVFAAPAAAGSFEPPRPSFTVAMARITASVAYGTLMTFSMLLAGLAVVFATHVIVVGPDLQAFQEIGIFAVTLALAVTSTVAYISVRYSPGAGKGGARLLFMGLLLLFFLNSRRLPDVALAGAAIAGVCALGSLLLLQRSLAR